MQLEDKGDFMDRLRVMLKNIDDSGKLKHNGVSAEMIYAQGIIFLGAGFETTASTLSLLCHCLAQNQEVQERCYQEIVENIDNVDQIRHEDIVELPYLEACVKETLRFRPPVVRNTRVCTKDIEIKGMYCLLCFFEFEADSE